MAFQEDTKEKFIKLIQAGTAPWLQSKQPGEITPPVNPASKHQFSGFNLIQLAAENRPDNRWCTFIQCRDNGWKVKQGAKSVLIAFKQYGQKKSFRYVRVFNAADIEGLPAGEKQEINETRTIVVSEALLQQHPGFEYNKDDAGKFNTLTEYYSDLFTRFSYWAAEKYMQEVYAAGSTKAQTGEAALKEQAKQEMLAAMTNYMVAAELGLGFKANPAFKQATAGLLENSPRELFRACHLAGQIKEFMVRGGDAFLQQKRARRQQFKQVRTPARQQAAAGLGY